MILLKNHRQQPKKHIVSHQYYPPGKKTGRAKNAAVNIPSQKPDNKITGINHLSQLIEAFNTTSSKLVRQNGWFDFKWQRSFYNHIIRDNKSLHNIHLFIEWNVLDWKPGDLLWGNGLDGGAPQG